jgi:hypothetical protein
LETYSECQRVKKDITTFRSRIVKHVPIPPGEYFEMGMYLESFRTYLSDFLALHESNYRSIRAAYLSTEGESAASAEVKAKASPEYRAYRYLERIDTLANEIALFIKKFEGRFADDGRM